MTPEEQWTKINNALQTTAELQAKHEIWIEELKEQVAAIGVKVDSVAESLVKVVEIVARTAVNLDAAYRSRRSADCDCADSRNPNYAAGRSNMKAVLPVQQ